ncbi:Gfo/Idh/MocA family oxidoreductase [Pelagicoccus sp. NFK12]|uniref:Gfo/Idh/MocA family oxidoreductase n=1 Tax=Pelagicoccus enzymogenes TaxID=2773457 RepID=A0A927IFL2_9BACT|nr:Gfo/Idh/MocA family oxidoreductase [Pelagicoccus enzymogenes]MBD5777914.1 Gfo/Idh/MocA family oxidoreductase [Pelagicoccus enzymogenes]
MPNHLVSEAFTPIKTAIVGYGQSGELSHAYGIQANPEFEIVAICDLSPQRRQFAQESIGCPAYADHRELLDSKAEIELASIVTRSDTHCQVACDLLDAGVNVLITKPWAVNTKEADLLIRAQLGSGKLIFPWIPMYWSPEYCKIKQLVEENAIGRVFTIRRYIAQFSKREDWQTELKFGGGYLNNWGAHIVQPLLELAGSPVTRVGGHLQQVINGGDGDDNFLALLEFESGILGIAEYAQATEGLPSFLVQGTQGTIVSDGETITLVQKDPASTKVPRRNEFPIEGKRFGDEAHIYRDVAATLRQGSPFRASLEDAYQGTRVLDAIREAHHKKSFVSDFLSLNSKLET